MLTIALTAAANGACSDTDSPASVPISGAGVASLDTVIVDALRRWDVPGGALAIAVNGRLVHARGYGYADLERTEQVRPDHLFRVASVSKPITSIGIMEAVEEGLLHPDARAFDLLSDLLPPGGPADARLTDISVAQLLHHTAGFTLWGYPDDPLHRMKEIAATMGVPSPPDGETIVRWTARQQLGFTPGDGFSYTNVAFVILARVIEEASGQPYESFVRQRVFAPIGASRPRIGAPRRTGRLPDEVEYESFFGEIWESIFEGEEGPVAEPAYGGINLMGLDGSSGWVLSVIDLARLGAAVDGDATRPDILAAPLRQLMFENGSAPGAPAYGTGWFLVTAAEAASADFDPVPFGEHSGGMPGTTAYFVVRDDGLVMAAAFNSNHGDAFLRAWARALHLAVAEIQVWPDGDLFGLYR